MRLTTPNGEPASPSPAALTTSVRSVAMPTEHGGWSLTLEPAILGLIVAPSIAGACLGLVALLAFIARTPLKLVLVDRWRDRSLPRTQLAKRVLAVEVVVMAAVVGVGFATASASFWWPLAVAAPLVAVELWYDMKSHSRRLVPELLGSIGIGSVAAAIVLADGGSKTLAAGLWIVIAARSVATIPFVRLQLRRKKEQAFQFWTSDLAQLAAVAAAVLAWIADLVSLPAVLAIATLALVQFVLSRRPVPAVQVVGAQQVVFGLAVVLTAGLGALAP